MFRDLGHPYVTRSDWRQFGKEYSRSLIAELIDRSEVEMPDWLVPLARGVAIAGDALLFKAGHRLGMDPPPGWRQIYGDVFMRYIGPEGFEDTQVLKVRQCCDQGLWTIERWREVRPYNNSDDILVHQFGSTPIFTRSFQAGMRLAELCHENGPPPGLRWIAACPSDCEVAIQFARARGIAEAHLPGMS
jgi:hypothetical protein